MSDSPARLIRDMKKRLGRPLTSDEADAERKHRLGARLIGDPASPLAITRGPFTTAEWVERYRNIRTEGEGGTPKTTEAEAPAPTPADREHVSKPEQPRRITRA